VKVPPRTAGTTTADSLTASAATTGTATANSLKAPARSYRRASLRSSLAALTAVLTSSGRYERAAPFIPARIGWFDSLCGRE